MRDELTNTRRHYQGLYYTYICITDRFDMENCRGNGEIQTNFKRKPSRTRELSKVM